MKDPHSHSDYACLLLRSTSVVGRFILCFLFLFFMFFLIETLAFVLMEPGDMMGLENNRQLESTVIIGMTDHYTYGYKNTPELLELFGVEPDKSILPETPHALSGRQIARIWKSPRP